MTAIGGYQSDLNLNDIRYVGNFPLANSLGGTGTTTGNSEAYALSLSPKLTEGNRPGLVLHVRFHRENDGNATLNVDGQGALPLTKVDAGGALVALEANDLAPGRFYLLVADGTQWQVAAGIAARLLNRSTDLFIEPEHIGSTILFTPSRNLYSVINGNLLLCRDIRLKRNGGPGDINGWVLNFPQPANLRATSIAGTVHTLQGNAFFYSLNGNGQLSLRGSLTDPNDEVLLNLNPYLINTPLAYHGPSPP